MVESSCITSPLPRRAPESMTISTPQLITCIYYWVHNSATVIILYSRSSWTANGRVNARAHAHSLIASAAPTSFAYESNCRIKQLYRCRRAVADLVLGSSLAHISSAATFVRRRTSTSIAILIYYFDSFCVFLLLNATHSPFHLCGNRLCVCVCAELDTFILFFCDIVLLPPWHDPCAFNICLLFTLVCAHAANRERIEFALCGDDSRTFGHIYNASKKTKRNQNEEKEKNITY